MNIKDYKPRLIDNKIKEYLNLAKAICIEGPKWCGKTWTSIYHSSSQYYVGDPSNNFTNRRLAEMDPLKVLSGDLPRLIDEWQEVPSLWDAIRMKVDETNLKGQYILTGSSTPVRKGVLHSGTGRIFKLRMNTMSLFESGDSDGKVSLKEICGNYFDKTILTGDVDLEKIAYLIVRGGWPDNINVPKEKAGVLPKGYIDSVLYEDIQKLDENVKYETNKVNLLLRSLARNESTTITNLSLSKDISATDNGLVSDETINKYLNSLSRLFLLDNQKPFSPAIRSSLRIKQGEKRHFCDPALACAALNLNETKLMTDLDTFGFMFEALVERDLRIYAQTFNAELFHYQDYSNNEIDAVIELEDGNWCAIEIKLGANQIDSAAAKLIKINKDISEHGGKPAKSLCVICGLVNAAYRRPDGVYVVPLTSLKN